MRRSQSHLQFLTADAAAMSSRSSYRGGGTWNRRGRSFSNRPHGYVAEERHFQSVQDANSGLREAETYYRFPNPNPRPSYRQRPPFDQNQFRNNQTVRTPRRWDYRVWEFPKTAPPPDAERFVVLSYNILADYLANDHRGKLYFHIPRYMMDWEWRKRKILVELRLWSPDIMCFQEVDKFEDLEEELKQQGYSGIWKMRTGNAVDGCAIFWRTSRFKLLNEESIEFNKLGLRDNVAQICVLELMNQFHAANATTPPISSGGSNKVVICNIHVLYNPKRGEIKLAQVRLLLDKAYTISKHWDDAPTIICGDFNCTPKSPLYNFIAEQKLDLSGVDRDKLSGQAYAAIHFPRSQSLSGASNLNFRQLSDNLNQAAPIEEDKQCGFPSELQNSDSSEKILESLPSSECVQTARREASLDASFKKCMDERCRGMGNALLVEETLEIQQDTIDRCEEGTGSFVSSAIDNCARHPTMSDGQSACCVNQMNTEICKPTPEPTSCLEDEGHSGNAMEPGKNDVTPNNHRDCEPSCSRIYTGSTISKGSSSQAIFDEVGGLSTMNQSIFARACISSYDREYEKPEDISNELRDLPLEGGATEENASTFLSALHGANDPFPCSIGSIMRPDMYSSSLWTPMEILTATGNAECTIVEHPLELRSTYVEVEDTTGTRDLNGEPLATSCNRCFLGTVDYIWRTKGLQTVRVLAPISKYAMQHSGGFPTKKWGSDHIALVSELALTKDTTLTSENH